MDSFFNVYMYIYLIVVEGLDVPWYPLQVGYLLGDTNSCLLSEEGQNISSCLTLALHFICVTIQNKVSVC